MESQPAITELIFMVLILIAGGMEAIELKICINRLTSKNISIKSLKIEKLPLLLIFMVTVANFSAFFTAIPILATLLNLESTLSYALN